MRPGVRRLVVSTHLDDAVLSLSHVLARGNVTVATVFTADPPPGVTLTDWDRRCGATDSTELMAARRAEDVAALACFPDVDHIHLGFVDSQYRTEDLPSLAITTRLNRLVPDYDEFWFPAGIGKHPDHVLVAKAANDVEGSHHAYMYADLPYTVAAWSTDDAQMPTITDVVDSSPWTPGELPNRVLLDTAILDQKRRALTCYASQMNAVLTDIPTDHDGTEWTWDLGVRRAPDIAVAMIADLHLTDFDTADGPFLSIIVRTQGRRPEKLTAALASLERQTVRDFEVVLVAHDVAPTILDDIRRQAQAMPSWLRESTTVVEAHDGQRGRPLNVGIDNAIGQYIAVLDDDDVAAPNWVHEFRELSRTHPGRVLKTRVRWVDMRDGSVYRISPATFDYSEHLWENRSPLNGLAYPRALLSPSGIRFDESLAVAEDWDVLVRAATLVGVASSAAITADYQNWHAGDDSFSLHESGVWTAAMRRIRRKLNDSALVLPPQAAQQIQQGWIDLEELKFRHDDLERSVREYIDRDVQRLAQIAELEWNAEQADPDVNLARMTDMFQRTSAELHRVSTELRVTARENAALRQTLESVTNSRTWRFTAPLRQARRFVRSNVKRPSPNRRARQ